MTTISPRNRAAILAALAGALALSACHTLFQHPRLASLQYSRPTDQRCLKCHKADDVSLWLQPANWRGASGAWSDFYDEPYWLEKHTRADTSTTTARSAPGAGK